MVVMDVAMCSTVAAAVCLLQLSVCLFEIYLGEYPRQDPYILPIIEGLHGLLTSVLLYHLQSCHEC